MDTPQVPTDPPVQEFPETVPSREGTLKAFGIAGGVIAVFLIVGVAVASSSDGHGGFSDFGMPRFGGSQQQQQQGEVAGVHAFGPFGQPQPTKEPTPTPPLSTSQNPTSIPLPSPALPNSNNPTAIPTSTPSPTPTEAPTPTASPSATMTPSPTP